MPDSKTKLSYLKETITGIASIDFMPESYHNARSITP